MCSRLTLPVALLRHGAGRRGGLLRAAGQVLEAAIGWHDDVTEDERHRVIHELVSLRGAMHRQALVQHNAIQAICVSPNLPLSQLSH